MNLQDMMYNRKGFIHHPETPPEDKAFYVHHKSKAHQLLQIGKDFIDNEGVLSHRSLPRGKEEFGSNSKYLHRGVVKVWSGPAIEATSQTDMFMTPPADFFFWMTILMTKWCRRSI